MGALSVLVAAAAAVIPDFMCSEITGRGTAGHIACIVQERCLQPGTDCKVLTLTEEWLQVLAF